MSLCWSGGMPSLSCNSIIINQIGKSPMFYLNLCLHILNGIRGLNLKGDGFPSKGFDEDLHFETFFVLNFFKMLWSVCVAIFCVTEVSQATWQLFIAAWVSSAGKLAQLHMMWLVHSDNSSVNKASYWSANPSLCSFIWPPRSFRCFLLLGRVCHNDVKLDLRYYNVKLR